MTNNDKLLRDNVIAPSSLEAPKQCILDWFSAKKRMRPIITNNNRCQFLVHALANEFGFEKLVLG